MVASAIFMPPGYEKQPEVVLPEPITPTLGWYEHFERYRGLYMAPQIYDWTCSICATTWVLQATGLDWYHFVGIRGVSGNNIWVANSAQSYKGIYELVSPGQWAAWAGSWKAVLLR
jgi:hypothetical protein